MIQSSNSDEINLNVFEIDFEQNDLPLKSVLKVDSCLNILNPFRQLFSNFINSIFIKVINCIQNYEK